LVVLIEAGLITPPHPIRLLVSLAATDTKAKKSEAENICDIVFSKGQTHFTGFALFAIL
jgi:hypothetical protein